MKIIKDNIWKYHKTDATSFIVITTNGFVKKNGECVMGRGIAQQTRDKFPGFAKKLGTAIKDAMNALTPEQRTNLENLWRAAANEITDHIETELSA